MMSAVTTGQQPEGLRLDELAREVPGVTAVMGDAAVRVRGVRHDSRTVQAGDLFVARRGEHDDGARFVADAVARGAAAVMGEAGAVDAEAISRHLYMAGMRDPDLIIRTSGEVRLSGFLLWQSAYSEFYFSDVYWPAFRRIDLLRAIRAYQQRRRRFGG